MAKVGKSARLKGHNFEREMANLFTEQTNLEWERSLQQTRTGGTVESDIYTESLKDTLHVECKRHARVSIPAAMQQCTDDAPDKTHIAITKSDRQPIYVTMKLDDWMKMFKAWMNESQSEAT